MPRVFVSIGSNQDRERSVRTAVSALERRFRDVRLSSVYETEAVGFEGDPFFNLVAGFETELDLEEVVRALRDIETLVGRVRTGKRFGPRTMDIDVLTYGDAVCDQDPVEVPRGEITRHAYVLHPLAELAPEATHPVLGESFSSLDRRLGLDRHGMRRVAFSPRGPEAA